MTSPDSFLPLDPVAAAYLFTNMIVFFLFALDKFRAQRSAWRIPERVLILAALAGPFGAAAAMLLLRHKTRKPLFFLLVPLFLVIHAGLILYFCTGRVLPAG